MSDNRPDPDALLQRVLADEARAQRGRLKIFFGASAGVGKTYAMLAAARAAQTQGIALVVGVVETHSRSDTEAMAAGLPRLALKDVAYRGRVLKEFDLDSALAFGAAHANTKPGALVLVDELAHSNAPADAGHGSRHPKRWQDVEELLAAGVNVWTTLNVQHLESLNDIVSGITGVRVWETVPDCVFDDADEVVVVDLPPDELLQRLKAGKVYLPNVGDNRAERAAGNFFRKGNLLALRELALRRTADRVDDEMQAYRKQSAVQPVWANRESLLACIGTGEHGEKVARSCARLATQLDVPWHAVHVESLALNARAAARREHAARVLKLAAELGATTATLSAADAATALLRYAREHNLARLVVGRSSNGSAWRLPWQRSLADRITAQAEDIDLLQVAVPSLGRGARLRRPAAAQREALLNAGAGAGAGLGAWPWQGYLAAVAICGATALLATPLMAVLELSNIVMLFLLAVVGVALGFGRGPAVLAAFVGVGLFDFLFVEPRFSFAVSDAQYLLTFAVMLLVALVIGQLTAGLKVQAEAATQRERRVRSLYEMSRDLSAALMPEQVAEIGARFLQSEFGAQSTLLVADANDRLVAVATARGPTDVAPPAVDMGAAQWAFDRGEAAGRGTHTLPGSAALVLPLKAPMRVRGVLSVHSSDPRALGTEQRRLLDTCASLLAISLERIHYIDVAQSSTVQIESERLRNSLLSAISHDLRTPLASLIGLADTLELTPPAPSNAQREVMQSIRQAALRMAALVNNLLDMARLQSGAVQLNLQWQPLEEVVGSALALCKQTLAGRPLQVRLQDGLPLLRLDAVLIERVLVNLLENAAKYTPAGSALEIAAQVEGDSVLVTLDDHGPGLPRGREEAIFQKFERGQKESATAGVGLGLAICRAILHAHGGRIEGATRPEGGARFTLTLPRGEPPADDGSVALQAAALPALSTASTITASPP